MDFRERKDQCLPIVIAGLLVSFIVGALTFFLIDRKTPVSADKILENVKNHFKEEGPIEGSWIEMTKVPWSKYSYDTKVYYGGLSRFEDGKITQYEFIADAYSGSVMDIYKI